MLSLEVLGDPWTLLLVRDAFLGRRTFTEFRSSLGISSDVLSDRLSALVESDVMRRVPYRASGQRTRHAYELTPAGADLSLALSALQQWGDTHLAPAGRLAVVATDRRSGARLHVSFVDDDGVVVAPRDVSFARQEPGRDVG